MSRRNASLLVLTLFAAFGLRAALADAPAPAPAAPAAPAPGAPAPQIKFDATEINLGDVVKGQDAVATFTYRNTGTVPLHILSAKPG